MDMCPNAHVGETNFTHRRGGGCTAIGLGALASHSLVRLILDRFREVVACHWIVARLYADTVWSFFADCRPACKKSMAVHRFFLASGPRRRLKLRHQCTQGVSLRFVLRHCLQCLL